MSYGREKSEDLALSNNPTEWADLNRRDTSGLVSLEEADSMFQAKDAFNAPPPRTITEQVGAAFPRAADQLPELSYGLIVLILLIIVVTALVTVLIVRRNPNKSASGRP